MPYDHVATAAAEDPFPELARLRSSCPVAHSSCYDGFWVLSRYEDVWAVARDPETFSSRDVTIPTEPFPPPPPISVDPPLHRDYRVPLLERFSPGAVGAHEDAIRDWAGGLIDAVVEEGRADFARDLCIPFPAYGSTRLLDLPLSDAPQFTEWAVKVFQNSGDLDVAMGFMQYFSALYDELDGSDGDDIPSLARRLVIDGHPIDGMNYAMMLSAIVGASLDTTANASSHMLLLLAERPALRAELVADPARLPVAIEELLRYISPLPALARVVNSDVELGGRTIRADERVLLSWIAANHDPAQFPDPDEIVLDRTPNRHLAFGAGPHRCLGIHLARLEIRVLLEEVLARIPDYRVLPDGVVRCGGITRMIRELPVEFPPGSRR